MGLRRERRGPDTDGLTRDALDVRIAHERWDLEDSAKRIENVATQCGSLITAVVAITAVTATAIASAYGLHPARLEGQGQSEFWVSGGAAAFCLATAVLIAILARTPPPRTKLGEIKVRRWNWPPTFELKRIHARTPRSAHYVRWITTILRRFERPSWISRLHAAKRGTAGLASPRKAWHSPRGRFISASASSSEPPASTSTASPDWRRVTTPVAESMDERLLQLVSVEKALGPLPSSAARSRFPSGMRSTHTWRIAVVAIESSRSV